MDRAKPKPLSDLAVLLQALVGFAVAALVMLGVAGLVYHVVAHGSGLVGAAALAVVIVVGACLWLARKFVPPQARSRYSELFVYGFAAAGFLYFIELVLERGF